MFQHGYRTQVFLKYGLIFLKPSFDNMAMFQDDSSDDEIGVNLQLAERLSINKNNRASNRNAMNEKDLKQIRNQHRQKNIIEDQSSSSSSLDMHNDMLSVSGTSSAYGFHNKKRQNGDKAIDLFANPKRTCLGDRLQRPSEWRKIGDISEVVQCIPQPSSSTRNLFPDNTYEDHLNNTSENEDSDLAIARENPMFHRTCTLPTGQNLMNPFENRPSGTHGVQFVDSTSDEDCFAMMQNGALKGGRQSPDPTCQKKGAGRKINKILDSDSDNEDWQISYRSRPLIFTSSDSDDTQPGTKGTKNNSDFASKKSANLPFSPAGAPKPDDHGYYRPGPPLYDCSNSRSKAPFSSSADLRPKTPLVKSHPTRPARKNSSMDWKKLFNPNESPQGGGDKNSPDIHSRSPSNLQPRMLRSRHLGATNSSKGRGRQSSPMGLNMLRPDLYSAAGNNSQYPPPPDLTSLNSPYRNAGNSSRSQEFLQGPLRSTRRSVKSSKGRALNRASAQNGKNNLSVRFPDLFDAESSSEVEFFTANSYSDNESNTESLNLRTKGPAFQNQPVQNPDDISVNVASSEDEISVVFSSAPCAPAIEPRRSVSRTLGRRYSRGSRRHMANMRDVASLSPDPVEQVRQVEEDERFARMLQAQFDAEVDPSYLPSERLIPSPVHINIREAASMGDDFSFAMTPPFPETEFMRQNAGALISFGSPMPQRINFTVNRLPHAPPEPPSHGEYRRPAEIESPLDTSDELEDDDSSSEEDESSELFDSDSSDETSPYSTTGRGRRRWIEHDQAIARPSRVSRAMGMFSHINEPFRISQMLFDNFDESYEAFLGLADMNGDVARGLQKAEINRLPTRKYVIPNGSSSSNGAEVPHRRAELNKECQVCLNDYVNGDVLRILPCFHEFHTPCIDPWLKINHTCPVCRVVVDLED